MSANNYTSTISGDVRTVFAITNTCEILKLNDTTTIPTTLSAGNVAHQSVRMLSGSRDHRHIDQYCFWVRNDGKWITRKEMSPCSRKEDLTY